mmetsp:Transcript_13498/g.20533  ORF Transcript_13498/g.20533 Transcript_13498/m.20533 type:complete len:345 (+) Transcript_13498:298-1332(+)
MASSLDLTFFDWFQRGRPTRTGPEGQGPSSGSGPTESQGDHPNRPEGLGQGQSGNRPDGSQSGLPNSPEQGQGPSSSSGHSGSQEDRPNRPGELAGNRPNESQSGRPNQGEGSSDSGLGSLQGDRPNRPAGQGSFDGRPSESLDGHPNRPGQSGGRPNRPDQGQSDNSHQPSDISETTDCNAKLFWVESGQSSTCSDYGVDEDRGHYLPLLNSPSDCYAWTGYGDGRTHENSAKNIRCSSDGMSVLYDQYAGNLNCFGSPVAKSYVLNECHQGRPSNLYDIGIDLSCCSHPEGEHCRNNLTGPPRNGRASALYSNGEQCHSDDGGSRMLGENNHWMVAGNLRRW